MASVSTAIVPATHLSNQPGGGRAVSPTFASGIPCTFIQAITADTNTKLNHELAMFGGKDQLGGTHPAERA